MKLLVTLFALGFMSHDYHTTIINIDYSDTENKFQITQQIFVDDFEAALKESGVEVKFGDDLLEQPASNEARKYLMQHFWIRVDGKPTRLRFVGAEWMEDLHTMNFYWETAVVQDVEFIDIYNDMFLEVSSDQQNMHHLKLGSKKPSLMLDAGKKEGRVFLK